MHELSIAMSLVDLACDEARRRGGARVAVVHVRVGRLAGVVMEPLRFSFEMAKQGTDISDARLEIEELPVIVWCPQCTSECALADIASRRCPICGTLAPEVRSGEELELRAIEFDDAADC